MKEYFLVSNMYIKNVTLLGYASLEKMQSLDKLARSNDLLKDLMRAGIHAEEEQEKPRQIQEEAEEEAVVLEVQEKMHLR